MRTHPVAGFGTQTKKNAEALEGTKNLRMIQKNQRMDEKKHRIRANKYRFKNAKRARVWVGCDGRENSGKNSERHSEGVSGAPGRLGGLQAPGICRRAIRAIGAVPLRRVVSIGIGGSPLRDHRRGIGATLRRWRALLPPAAPATTSPKPPQKKTCLL